MSPHMVKTPEIFVLILNLEQLNSNSLVIGN